MSIYYILYNLYILYILDLLSILAMADLSVTGPWSVLAAVCLFHPSPSPVLEFVNVSPHGPLVGLSALRVPLCEMCKFERSQTPKL